MKKTLSLILISIINLYGIDLSITEFKAVGDGKTVNTAFIQKAINEVNKKGGGKVIIPKGQFVTGTLYLKSNVTLFLSGQAELLGSRSLSDYPKTNPGSGEVRANHTTPEAGTLSASEFIQALIIADQVSNVSIEGNGTIDGRGKEDAFPIQIPGSKKLGDRPMLMRFYKCKDVYFKGTTFKDPASWGVHLVDCDNVHFEKITIRHHAKQNNDGIDIDGCRNVFISDCDISSGDDAICPKSSHGRPCENIFIRNCVIQSNTSALKTGTSSRAGFRNIIMSDCVIRDTPLGAIKLLCVDGGTLENILIQNIIMENVEGPLFIRLGNRGSAYQTPTEDGGPVPVGTVKNITISNIRATISTKDKARSGIMISGIPGHRISGIKLDNIDLRFPGMGPVDPAEKAVPEDEKNYPEQFFFGPLPSYAAYIRHAEDIEFTRVRFSYSGEEARPPIVLDDVTGFTLKDSKVKAGGQCVIDLKNTSAVSVTGCTIAGKPETAVVKKGQLTSEIESINNKLTPINTKNIH